MYIIFTNEHRYVNHTLHTDTNKYSCGNSIKIAKKNKETYAIDQRRNSNESGNGEISNYFFFVETTATKNSFTNFIPYKQSLP